VCIRTRRRGTSQKTLRRTSPIRKYVETSSLLPWPRTSAQVRVRRDCRKGEQENGRSNAGPVQTRSRQTQKKENVLEGAVRGGTARAAGTMPVGKSPGGRDLNSGVRGSKADVPWCPSLVQNGDDRTQKRRRRFGGSPQGGSLAVPQVPFCVRPAASSSSQRMKNAGKGRRKG